MEHIPIKELTPDQTESELTRLEGMVARIRGVQAQLIDHANELALPRMDGARSLVDWVAARLDVTRETALDLARVARCDDVDDLVAGDVSFDRAVVRRRLVEVGAQRRSSPSPTGTTWPGCGVWWPGTVAFSAATNNKPSRDGHWCLRRATTTR